MNERALITIAVLSLFLIGCSLFAISAPGSRRVFWILGLSLALLEFGTLTIGGVLHAMSHRRLSFHGFLNLLAMGFVCVAIGKYLRQKINAPKVRSGKLRDPLQHHD